MRVITKDDPAPDALPVAIDAVLVHYGDPEGTRAAVARLAALDLASVTVVDNSGNLREAGAARVLEPGRNLGFGAGVNLGAAAAEAPWLLVLNPDAELAPGSLMGLASAAARASSHAILAPRLEYPDGSAQVNGGVCSGWIRETARMLGIGSQLRRLRCRFRRDTAPGPPGRELVDRPWVSGAAMLVRRQAFREIGGFDERFFLYHEDDDLCRRLRERGWRIGVETGAVVRHAVGGATAGADPYRSPHFERSRRLYHELHSGPLLRRLVRLHSKRQEARAGAPGGPAASADRS